MISLQYRGAEELENSWTRIECVVRNNNGSGNFSEALLNSLPSPDFYVRSLGLKISSKK